MCDVCLYVSRVCSLTRVCSGTVGQIGIQADADNGGVTLWVPCYDKSNIVQLQL